MAGPRWRSSSHAGFDPLEPGLRASVLRSTTGGPRGTMDRAYEDSSFPRFRLPSSRRSSAVECCRGTGQPGGELAAILNSVASPTAATSAVRQGANPGSCAAADRLRQPRIPARSAVGRRDPLIQGLELLRARVTTPVQWPSSHSQHLRDYGSLCRTCEARWGSDPISIRARGFDD